MLHVSAPDAHQRRVIVDGIHRAVARRLGIAGPGALIDEVAVALAGHEPRRASRVIELAFGFMAAGRRDTLAPVDVERAGMLADAGIARFPVGFRPSR